MQIKQSTSALDLVFYMVDSSDHVTPKTGLSPTVTISKNGAAFGSPSGSVTEISGGFYKLAGNTTDSNTLGMLALKATATGADPVAMSYEVVANITSDIAALTADTAIRSAVGLASANMDTQLSGIAAAVWDKLLTGITTAGSIGKKLKDWVLGSDNKVLLSTDAQSGVTIPTVTTLTNAPSVPSASTIAAAVRTELVSELARVSNCATVDSTAAQLASL